MSKLLHDAEALLPLGLHRERMQAFRREVHAASLVRQISAAFFDLLSCYVDALSETVAVLVERQRLMNEGSNGGVNNPMTWQAFQEDTFVSEKCRRIHGNRRRAQWCRANSFRNGS